MGHNGFDTHENQASRLNPLLGEVAGALDAFVQDVKAMGAWEDTCIVVFSEFGRNCAENNSGGTDHGYAGSTVVLGGAVSGGLYGDSPSEDDLAQSAVPYSTDFRSVLRPLVADHLGFDPTGIFDEASTTGDLALLG